MTPQSAVPHFACAYRVTSLVPPRSLVEPSWGHAQIFRNRAVRKHLGAVGE